MKLCQLFRKKFIENNILLSELFYGIQSLIEKNIENNQQGLFNEILDFSDVKEQNPELEVESKNINLLIRYFEDEGFKMVSLEDLGNFNFKININL